MYEESLLDFKHVVLPHWLDDCFRLKQRVDEEGYQFPNPVFSETATIFEYPSIDVLDRLKLLNNKVLQDQVVYLGSDIDIATAGFIPKLAACIENAGGTLIDRYDDSVSIVVCKYRSSQDCIKALEDQNIVVSFWWLTNTLARGHIETPLSRLLDYPIPKGGILGMDNLRVSITGYTEINRDYLRRLLLYTGAVFDPIMDRECTHLICAGSNSSKFQRAKKRGIIIINQLWLEETFQQWQVMPTDDTRYQYFPTNNTLNLISATTPLIPSQVRLWMKKETTPFCTKEKKIYKPLKPTPNNIINKPRAAAVKANRVLHNTLMPDANAYKKENPKRKEGRLRETRAQY
ncbi:hypothetical protein K501DRAFT_179934 [Backusella circina FSU 941]|nr:hypothetical protein K501DRAFT_179934 [Backusella circina FSU 941]